VQKQQLESMSALPLVTIIVLLYNDENFAARAIESVLNQSYPNLSVKILDNGSTDRTREIALKYANDPRVEVVCNGKNLKSEFATRIAMKIESDYLGFLFSDDYYSKDKIEKQVDFLTRNSLHGAVFSNSKFIDDTGRPLSKVPRTQFSGDISTKTRNEHLRYFFYNGNSLHPCGMLIRTEIYKSLGGFKGYLHRIGDLAFFARLLGSYEVGFLNEPLQVITVFKNGRNQSSSNLNSIAVSYESITLLECFKEPAIFNRLPEIFDSPFDFKHQLSTDAERYWYLGQKAIRVPGNMRYFGMECLYKAASLDEESLNRKTLQSMGLSLGEYFDSLTTSFNRAEGGFKKALKKFLPPIIFDFLRFIKLKILRPN
jgi:glycosyltransferase involved in cell wall biosynthesis